MPVVYRQLSPANAHLPTYSLAKELAQQCVAQFGAVRHTQAGVGSDSCCAAVAITPIDGHGAVGPVVGYDEQQGPVLGPVPAAAAQQYAVVFGNSQMAAGLVQNPVVGGHAERAALTVAPLGAALYSPPAAPAQAALFVELTPCINCQNWLAGAGGGVPNPFAAAIAPGGPVTLNVWWRWDYPDAVQATPLAGAHGVFMPLNGVVGMGTFHGGTPLNQLVDTSSW
ncbi:hypothetical protein [Cryptosporangium phraense]|uniref:Uncharacterized protein n=1 Tax=Cryptosporangium phraense TaxID=2593070 RepID=A0A545APW7_9ACTN|nr:hypothetical protein [Cryptosporangium phraense]TQS43377.1 hypothetical protein FL583_19280 [Cryptosporangium phraense]